MDHLTDACVEFALLEAKQHHINLWAFLLGVFDDLVEDLLVTTFWIVKPGQIYKIGRLLFITQKWDVGVNCNLSSLRGKLSFFSLLS